VKLQEQYGDDIQVIFVECQNTPKDVYEAFAWKQKWMGNNAWWTVERPFPTKGTGLPETALVGVDGTILMQGNPGSFGKKFEETIAAEVKKSKSAPASTPKALEGAWKSYAKGDVGAAIAECEKLATDDANKAKDEFVARITARITRTQWMIENGFLSAAEKSVTDLEKAVKGNADLTTKVAAKRSQLASKELDAEREADKALQSFVAEVAKKKPFEAPNVKKADTLAEKFKSTKTSARLERFVALSKVELNK
jgi:hypothetical protein